MCCDRRISSATQVDESLYAPMSVDFTPNVTLPALAKVIAGTMIGLMLVTVITLLTMGRRVRTRGGYGRKASAVLRSVYPIVLGLAAGSRACCSC
jgi:hypothetical protein